MARDYYQLLEVSRNASKKEIRKAFRVKAMEIHPDHNPDDPQANARFITLKRAHDLLVDPVRRKKYDRDLLRSENTKYRRSRRSAGKSRHASAQRNSSTGSRTAQTPRRSHDIRQTYRVYLRDAWIGAKHTVRHPTYGFQEKTFRVPRGARDGTEVIVKGFGKKGYSGNLILVLEIVPDKRFARDGDNLKTNLSVDYETAKAGGIAKVNSISGARISVRIPPNARSGLKLRVKGHGMPRMGTATEYGDLYVRIKVKKPVAIQGNNIEEKLLISLKEAWSGGNYKASVNKPGITFAIPRGSKSKQRIHIKGAGQPGKNGGPPGDLYITLEVLPHEHFRREGDDLYLNERVEIDLQIAQQGGTVEVFTFSGTTKLAIPPGTRSGTDLCLPNQGMPRMGKPGQFGDLILRMFVQTPSGEQWHRSSSTPGSVRDTWYWPNLPSRIQEPNSLYMKIQFKENTRFGYYDWAVLVNNSDLEFRGRKVEYSGRCYPTRDDDQAKRDAAAQARDKAIGALLLRTQDEYIPVDVNDIPF